MVKETPRVRGHNVSPAIARVIFEKGMSHCSPTARFYALERSIRCCRSLTLPSRPCPSCGHPARLRRRAIPGPRGLLTVWSPLSPPTGWPSLRPWWLRRSDARMAWDSPQGQPLANSICRRLAQSRDCPGDTEYRWLPTLEVLCRPEALCSCLKQRSSGRSCPSRHSGL